MLRGSVLFPDRLLHKLHGRGLAKSTICWISLSIFRSLSLSLFLLSLLPLFPLVCLFFSFITNMERKKKKKKNCSDSQTVYKTRAFCWLEQRAQLRQVVRFFFSFLFFFAEHLLPEIFRDTTVFSQRTCFFAISRMI